MPEEKHAETGRYRIRKVLGEGGTGRVYQVLDQESGMLRAMKCIAREHLQTSEWEQQALETEIAVLGGLHHEGLPALVEVLEDPCMVRIVMTFIEGRTLKMLLEERMRDTGSPMDWREVVRWGLDLCDLLHYLHTKQDPVIYGDLKLSNIMVRDDGRLALIDFGAASFLNHGDRAAGSSFGTPGYAAPEQYGNGGETGPETDLFALGAVMHHLLTGRDPSQTPFYFPDAAVYLKLCGTVGGVGDERALKRLCTIIEHCTAYDRKVRYASCEAVADDLRALEADRTRKISRPIISGWFSLRRMLAFLCVGVGLWMALQLYGGIREAALYEVYLQQADEAEGETRLSLIEAAAALKPEAEAAYLALLDGYLADGIFSDAEEGQLMAFLYGSEAGWKRDRRSYLEENREGYLIFSYRLGMAYVCLRGSEADRQVAVSWLQSVAGADMETLDSGDDEGRKGIWKKRASALLQLMSCHEQLRQAAQTASERNQLWKRCLTSLEQLMEDARAKEEGMAVELRLYQEIALRILEGAAELKAAGADQEQLAYILDEILARTETAASEGQRMQAPGEALEEQQIQNLKNEMEVLIGKARQYMAVVYADE